MSEVIYHASECPHRGVSLAWATEGAERAGLACLSPWPCHYLLQLPRLAPVQTPIRHYCGTSEAWRILKAIYTVTCLTTVSMDLRFRSI
jgi:hypothetical protein